MKYILYALLLLFSLNVLADFDQNDPADLAALKAEVENDPESKGYNPALGTQQLLDMLNAKTEIVSNDFIRSEDIVSNTTYQAYRTLSANEQEWLIWITSICSGSDMPSLKVTVDLRKKLTQTTSRGVSGGVSIWEASHKTAMEAAMLDLIDVPGSRIEVLFGVGSRVGREDWFAARDSN